MPFSISKNQLHWVLFIYKFLILDETKIESLGGMINCKIMDGHLEDAI